MTKPVNRRRISLQVNAMRPSGSCSPTGDEDGQQGVGDHRQQGPVSPGDPSADLVGRSSPARPLPAWTASSMVQRRPATRTSCALASPAAGLAGRPGRARAGRQPPAAHRLVSSQQPVDQRGRRGHRGDEQQPSAQERGLVQPGLSTHHRIALPHDPGQEQQERQRGAQHRHPDVVHDRDPRPGQPGQPGPQHPVRARGQRGQHQVVPDDGGREPDQHPRPQRIPGDDRDREPGYRERQQRGDQMARTGP